MSSLRVDADDVGTVPTDRLRPIVEEYLERGGSRHVAGMSPRGFHKVLYEATLVTFDFADRLLIAIGREEEWHIALADLYEVELEATG